MIVIIIISIIIIIIIYITIITLLSFSLFLGVACISFEFANYVLWYKKKKLKN